MSGFVEKVKEKVEAVLNKDSTHSGTTATGTTGTHGHHHNTTGVTGNTSTNYGPHDSNLANKADPRVDSDRDGSANAGIAATGPGAHHNTTGNTGFTGTSGSTSTNYGPHDSNLANKLDPRVDSDGDGSRNAGAASYGPGSHSTGVTGTTGVGSTGVGSGSSNYGPHDSNLANKFDPRVDSDRDGSRNAGAASYGPGGQQNTSGYGSTGLGSGTTSSYGSTGVGSGSTNYGPHDSNLANKLDPRVDSDRDGSRNSGAASYGPGAQQNTSGFGSTGVGSGSTNYGPHDSNLGNKLDPRVDSDRDGSRNAGAASYGPGAQNTSGFGGSGPGTFGSSGPGPAPNTAGPHKSDTLNKLDPRVDSDLDGSRTVGGNQTGGVGGTGTGAQY